MISTRDIGVSADAALNGKAAGCTPQGTRERMEVKAFGATFGMTPAVRGWLALALVLTVAGCGLGGEAKYRDETAERYEETRGSLLGDDRIGIGNEAPDRPGSGGGDGGIGVNSYLWRASLDTVSFMPLASADPFAVVIIFAPISAAANPWAATPRLRATTAHSATHRRRARKRKNGQAAWRGKGVQEVDNKVDGGTIKKKTKKT